MGVKGLTTFLAERVQLHHPSIPPTTFWDTNKNSNAEDSGIGFIIDGNSLLYAVAYEHKHDFRLGANFEMLVHHFISKCKLLLSFATTNNKSFIVWDGVLPKSKHGTRLARDQGKVCRIVQIMASQRTQSALLPPLAVHAVIHACQSIWPQFSSSSPSSVQVSLATEEADIFISRLSQKLTNLFPSSRYFVLSQDSDFFIHSVPNYIPLDSITIATSATSPCFMTVPVVFTPSLVSQLLSLQSNPIHLPLLAALVGCDYTTIPADLTGIISTLGKESYKQLPTASSSSSSLFRINQAIWILQRVMESPLISQHQPSRESDAKLVKQLLPKSDQQESRTELLESMGEYRHYNSSSLPPPLFDNLLLSHKLLEVVQQSVFWCTPYIEDIARSSVWLLGRPLRRRIYGMILGGQHHLSSGSSSSSSSSFVVTEYIRKGGRMVAEGVEADKCRCCCTSLKSTSPNLILQYFDLMHIETQQQQQSQLLHKLPSACLKLPHDMIPLVASLRHLIIQLASSPTTNTINNRLANFELIAIVCAAVSSSRKPAAAGGCSYRVGFSSLLDINRGSMHRIAQLEQILFHALLIWQSLLHHHQSSSSLSSSNSSTSIISSSTTITSSISSGHWTVLNGPLIHTCIRLAKGGASISRLLGEGVCTTTGEIELVQQVLEAISAEGVGDLVDEVLVYNSNNSTGVDNNCDKSKSKLKKNRKTASGGEGKGTVQANMLAGTNIFDVLSEGCNF